MSNDHIDDERLLDEEQEASLQHDLAQCRAIQQRLDCVAPPADLDEEFREMQELIDEGLLHRRIRARLQQRAI